MLRRVPEDLDPAVVAEIDARLDGVVRDHGVGVPWAIESGSRAWGFPSPDSDYDCRFLYVRPARDYLSLWPDRDVIETPLDEVFDVNGWDLAKAVRLLTQGNAVVVEWLRSPIVYRGDETFRDGLLALAAEVADRPLTGRHYLHTGRNNWRADGSEVKLKRIFYALRAAAALRWLLENPASAVVPMELETLLAESDPPEPVLRETRELLERKRVTREIGTGATPPAVAAFIEAEFARADELYERAELRPSAEKRAAADAFFRRMTLG
ncbi:nucleotidyltransferase domain-containing protein [Frondihabitans peucedani]|uniref:Nucleotidyltransferase domain-containing protein n=1 Tax=Frondihabitans peucedani TaxID=598626 RepID=A0ABP8E073_9MICO